MLFKKAILPMIILASLAGCGPASLDGSSQDALDASISKIASKLPDGQRPQFGADVDLVKSYYAKQNQDLLLTNLNGKNALEIASEANNLREQLKLEEEKIAVEEMKKTYLLELADKKTNLLASINPLKESKKQSLDRAEFKIVRANISLAKKEAGGENVNAIDLTVTNGTTQEIYNGFFKASLNVAGEDKARLTSSINVAFENGLQPGETRTVMFVPTLASEWRTVELPASGLFTLVTDELMNIANKPLFSVAEFTADDQEALDKLSTELDVVTHELGIVDGSTEKTVEKATEAPPALQPETHEELSAPASLLPEADAPQVLNEGPTIERVDLPSDVPVEPEANVVVPQPVVIPTEAASAPIIQVAPPATAPAIEVAPTLAPAPAPAPTIEVAPTPVPGIEAAPAPAIEAAPDAPIELKPTLANEAPSPDPVVKIEDVSPVSASTPVRVRAKTS